MTTYSQYGFSRPGSLDSERYDVAIITLSPSGSQVRVPIGIAMGTFGVSKFPVLPSCCESSVPCLTYEFQADDWRITGYPGDKPRGTMWDTGTCDKWVYSCGKVIRHTCDTSGGMSGSAIRDGEDKIIGVNFGSVYFDFGGTTTTIFNSGVQIDDEHLANIEFILSGGQLV